MKPKIYDSEFQITTREEAQAWVNFFYPRPHGTFKAVLEEECDNPIHARGSMYIVKADTTQTLDGIEVWPVHNSVLTLFRTDQGENPPYPPHVPSIDSPDGGSTWLTLDGVLFNTPTIPHDPKSSQEYIDEARPHLQEKLDAMTTLQKKYDEHWANK